MPHSFKHTRLSIYVTVSEHLRTAREQRGLTLEDCAHALNIQQKYLRALEESKYDKLPGEIYTKAWIKKYAQFLELSADDITISFEKEAKIRKKIEKTHDETTVPNRGTFWPTITARRLILVTLIVLLIGYISYLIYDTIRPPHVALNVPLEGFRTQENSTIIKGLTEAGVQVLINKQAITLDDANSFTETVILLDGLNTISIEAKKKHSRSYDHDVHIVRTPLPELQTEEKTGP